MIAGLLSMNVLIPFLYGSKKHVTYIGYKAYYLKLKNKISPNLKKYYG